MSREPDAPAAPLGFKVFLVVAGFYLLLRLGQGIAWLLERLG
jgi:hypothetical protein